MDDTSPVPYHNDPQPVQLLDCGRQNCRILNPVNPAVWCRACLLTDVERYRERDLRRARSQDDFDY